MKRFLAKSQYRLRWRIYLRVVPVLGLGLLFAGALGWWGVLRTMETHQWQAQEQALKELVRTARTQAVLAAVGLDTERAVAGSVVALAPGGDTEELVLTAGLDRRVNRATAAAWLATGLAADGSSVARAAAVPAPAAGLTVELHAPIFLQAAVDSPLAVLPVVVRRVATGSPSIVGWLDLAGLLPAPCGGVDWCCLATPEGEILLANGMADPPPDLLAGWRPAAPDGPAVRTNAGPDGWALSCRRAGDLPCEVLVASRPEPPSALARTVHLAGAGLGLLILVLLAIGTEGVLRNVSRRLRGLGEAMEALARGEDSHRLTVGGRDEIGQLEGYFNLMAGSLDEAHRELRDKESRLSGSLESMRLLDQAKDDFLVLVSHEVRTPLTCIRGGLDHLRTAMRAAPDGDLDTLERLGLADIVDVIASSTRRLHGFLNDALQITAIQSGDRDLALRPLPPAQVLAPGLTRIATVTGERGITVVNELSPCADWLFLADEKILDMAVTRLLDNAARHNVEGGRILLREVTQVPDIGAVGDLVTAEGCHRLEDQPEYETWADEELRWRIIEIHNTGPAIPADRMSALFGKFETVEPIANHSRGSGLSLPITKAAVERHGGRVLARSVDMDGTSFYLLLPTLAADAVPAGPQGLWDDLPEGVGGGSADEVIRQVADAARLEVELDDRDAPAAGEADQPGGGVDGAGSADHEEEPATCDSVL